MSLLPVLNAARAEGQENPEYYFALSGGNSGAVVDSSFVATGLGSPPNGGSFQAISEPVGPLPNATTAYIIADLSGVKRWAWGVNNVEAGANSGSDLLLQGYNDAGAVLNNPLSVNRASGQVVVDTGLTVDGAVNITGNVSAANIATGNNRSAIASFVPDAITVNPNVVFGILNNASMPDLAAIIANPAVNVIQLFAQFGIQTTAGQPKFQIGLSCQANGGVAAFTTGTTCLGQGVPVPATSPSECSYVLYANLIRGVHFNNTTTNIAISFTANTTPTGAVITLLNNDDDGTTPTSPSIVVSALGLM